MTTKNKRVGEKTTSFTWLHSRRYSIAVQIIIAQLEIKNKKFRVTPWPKAHIRNPRAPKTTVKVLTDLIHANFSAELSSACTCILQFFLPHSSFHHFFGLGCQGFVHSSRLTNLPFFLSFRSILSCSFHR